MLIISTTAAAIATTITGTIMMTTVRDAFPEKKQGTLFSAMIRNRKKFLCIHLITFCRRIRQIRRQRWQRRRRFLKEFVPLKSKITTGSANSAPFPPATTQSNL